MSYLDELNQINFNDETLVKLTSELLQYLNVCIKLWVSNVW